MLTYTHDGLSLTVEFDHYTPFSNRCAWRYTISEAPGATCGAATVLYTDDDLETGKYDMVEALRSLHSFLTAWDESMNYPDGENRDLFPADLHDKLDWSDWLGHAYGDLYGEDDR